LTTPKVTESGPKGGGVEAAPRTLNLKEVGVNRTAPMLVNAFPDYTVASA